MQFTIEIDGDEARASSRVMAWHWFHREDGDEHSQTDLLAIGGYQDRLRRTPDGWRIYERRGVKFGTGVGIGNVPEQMKPVFDGMGGRLSQWP